MLSFLLFSISRAWQGFWRNAAMSLAATATMTLMLLLLAGFWIVQAGFLASLTYVEDKVGVVADLHDTIKDADRLDVIARLNAMPEVRSVEYVSKAEALKRYREERVSQGQEDLTSGSARSRVSRSWSVAVLTPSSRSATTPTLSST